MPRSIAVFRRLAQGEGHAPQEMSCQGLAECPPAAVLPHKPRPPLLQQQAGAPPPPRPFILRSPIDPEALEALHGPVDALEAGEGLPEVCPAAPPPPEKETPGGGARAT